MPLDILTVTAAVCGSLLTILAFLAAAWKFALPWVRKEIATPAQEAQQQVTNSHATNLRDDVTGIENTLTEVRTLLAAHLEAALVDRTRTEEMALDLRAVREEQIRQGARIESLENQRPRRGLRNAIRLDS